MKDEELLQILKSSLPDVACSIADRNRIKITTTKDRIRSTCEAVKSVGFDYLHTIVVTDYPASSEFEVNYIVGSMHEDKRNNVVMIITRVKKSEAILPTMSDLWQAAKQEEREEWETLGINFLGNDELKRLYLPEDWNEIPPLLKEYKLKRWVDEERLRHNMVIERIEHEHE